MSIGQNSSLGNNFSADFETTTDIADCRVWCWGFVPVREDVTQDEMVCGTDIESFLQTVATMNNCVMYFHNLAFDGYFILDWLLSNGFQWATDHLRSGEFSTLISRNKKFYSMKVMWKNGNITEFRDSFKKITMSVDQMAKAFDLPLSKLHIDYDEFRPVGYQPSAHEWDYLANDILIVARSMAVQLRQGMTKLTTGADSLAEYKKLFGGNKLFERVFPVLALDVDKDIRGAYRGGWTFRDERFSQTIVGPGSVYDVNSLYPSVMYYKPLPYGIPKWFTGEPTTDEMYPLFIVSITFTAKLKPDHLPTIQVKSHPVFIETEYVSEIPEPETMVVTNVDLELWSKHYDLDILSWNGGWKFKSKIGFFRDYIDKWSKIKNESEGGMRLIAKLHLNSLYGKFATNPDVTGKQPYMENGVVKLRNNEEETRNPVYTAMGVFITAYGRQITITAAQDNYDVFAYADTDSVHLLTTDTPNNMVIGDVLGAWKHEHDFDYAIFWRAKVYMERVMGGKRDGQYETHVAGMPVSVQKHLRFSDFESNKVFDGKLLPKHVPGGIVLVNGTYTLK